MLEGLGARVTSVRRAGDIDGLDGLVIPGGESSTIDRLTRTFGCADALGGALSEGLPVLGTCAGLIMLATGIVDPAPGQKSLAVIDMVVRRNAFGPQINSAVESVETTFGPATGAFIRAPRVEAVGEGTRVVAKRGDAIVGVETDTALAVSFHPELTGDDTVHRHFLEKLGLYRKDV